MSEQQIRFPVTCPVCGQEALLSRPMAQIAAAVMSPGAKLELHTPCHGRRWMASREELEQIREYLAVFLTAGVGTLERSNPQSRR